MGSIRSRDGTTIVFEQFGAGPPVILVAGALGDRLLLRPLAAALGASFTAVTYDRRGRAAGGDALHHALEREIEDLGSLICRVGGVASLFGHVAGAVLALRAAACGLPIAALALYEPPFRDDADSSTAPTHLPNRPPEAVPLVVLSAIRTPTVVLDGEQSCEGKRSVARKVAHALPNGRHCTLVGESPHLEAKLIAPLLEEFFSRVLL
jgi:pimeloyl-ACP methyl ester carboxylesterase